MACNSYYSDNIVLGTLKLEQVPKGLQNFVEAVYEYVSGIAKDQIGEYEYRPWVPFVGTIFYLSSFQTG